MSNKNQTLQDRVEHLEIIHETTCSLIDDQMINVINELQDIQIKITEFRSNIENINKLKKNLLDVCYIIRSRTAKVENKLNRVLDE